MSLPKIPGWVSVYFAHAALQATADRLGVDILHIKGPAQDKSLKHEDYDSTDADVLVRPAHLKKFVDELVKNGWTEYSNFDEGSPFGHAANFTHDKFAMADVHRWLPGPTVAADEAFSILWRDHFRVDIAHVPCAVPSLAGQVTVQTLHAARSHKQEKPVAWECSSDEQRIEALALAHELGAEVPYAAGLGRLEEFKDAKNYELWALWSGNPGGRVDHWLARFKAARSFKEWLWTVRSMFAVNRTHLRLRLGREPRGWDLFREQFSRIRRAIISVRRRYKRN